MSCAGSKRRGVPRRWTERTGWTVAACLIFGLATALQYQQVLRGELGTSIAVPRPVPEAPGAPSERADHLWPSDLAGLRRQWEDWDHGFSVWVVSRNAHTLLTEPSRLFGEGPCFPFPRPLALGHPAVSQGILAIPAYAVTGNPIASYNSVMILASFLAALAMYLLVRDWTGSPGAGIAAGLLYAFHGARISLATYPFIIDLAWTLFALRLGERYFEQGRWRDALLAALCIALQLCMSLYASLVCVLVLLPYLIWLLTKHGLSKLRPGPVVAALAVIGLSTALVYAPYLGVAETSGNRFRYAALWSGFLPGRFVGWLIFLFALVSLLPGSRQSGTSRRWALLASCALVLWLATGDNEAAQRIAERAGDPTPLALPNPYRILDFLPGLPLIRGPSVLSSGVHLLLSILAGLGIARLIRWTPPPWKLAISAVVICVAFADTLHPELLGRRAPVEFHTLGLRPWERNAREFFEELEALGNRGPVVEVPAGPPWELHRESSRTLLSAYHHRPTSACHNSVIPAEVKRVRTLTDRLPNDDALRELRSLGFTTLVVHGGPPIQKPFRAAARQGDLLEEVHGTLRMAAYSISP
jgi:hypothetical protein